MPPRGVTSESEAASPPVALDLFSGAGGFSLGLAAAGIEVAGATDAWEAAARTYRRNFPDHPFQQADARDLTPAAVRDLVSGTTTGGPLTLVGGPPCQGFSSAGSRGPEDHRNSLVGVYATLAAEVRPQAVVFENVEGFLTAEGGRFVFDLLDPLIDAGYQVSLGKVNVANYGVPQLRKRVIVIASLGRRPAALVPSHRAFGSPGAWRVGAALPPTRTVAEALDGLPSPSGDARTSPTHHVPPMATDDDLRRYAALLAGQTMRDLPEELWPESYRRRANRRVSDGTASEGRGGAPAALRRLLADEPSKAITGLSMHEFVHPTEDRMLTLRECARIQSFPDSFEFVGSRRAVRTLVGNAVPPAFARAVGVAVRETLRLPVDLTLNRGRLLRFDATNARATSPALAAVLRRVESRYGRCGTSEPGEVQEALWA